MEDSLTLALDGDVSLDDFSSALSNLKSLLSALAKQVSPEADIHWTIEALDRSSAITAVRGEERNGDTAEVDAVVRAYGKVGSCMERKQVIPYAESVRRPARRLSSLVSVRIPSVRFETDSASAYITAPMPGEPIPKLPSWTHGSIQGRIQTLTNRGSLHFTLYDTLWDRAVQCFLLAQDESILMHAWGHMAFVEGHIKRDPRTGRPLTIRQVGQVVLLPEYGPRDWDRLQGSIASDGESSDAFVRRLRNLD